MQPCLLHTDIAIPVVRLKAWGAELLVYIPCQLRLLIPSQAAGTPLDGESAGSGELLLKGPEVEGFDYNHTSGRHLF